MNDIYKLVKQFRIVIEDAADAGEFIKDCRFCQFPRGCCDDTCDLLGQYLLENGVRTYQIAGTYRDGIFENTTGHAWLQLNEHTIIDITGDQFRLNKIFYNFDQPVYIGQTNKFYKLFEIERIYENYDFIANGNSRLNNLYHIILKYISKNGGR